MHPCSMQSLGPVWPVLYLLLLYLALLPQFADFSLVVVLLLNVLAFNIML